MSTIKSSAENLTLNADGSGNDIIIQSNGSTKAIVTAEGNVGIGVTPDSKLTVASGSDSTGAGDGVAFYGGSSNKQAAIESYNAGGYSGDLRFYTVNKSSASTTVAESMRIDSSGKVGIGTVTAARTLHVNSADANVASFEGHQGEGLVISSGTNGQIDIIGYDDGASAYNPIAIRSASAGGIFLDTTGAVTMPAQPAFLVGASSTQSNKTVDTDHTVLFGAEIFDVNSDFASNTFTAPVTGKYQLNANVRIDNLDAGALYYHLKIKTSNREYWSIFDPDFGQNNQYWHLSLSILADMDANDTAIVEFYQSGASAQTDIDGDTKYTNFSGYLAC